MYKTILAPIDMAHIAKGKAVIDIAAAQTDKDAHIILLNVVEEIPGWAAVELPSGILEKSLRASQDRLETIASDSGMDMEVVVLMGHSHKTILEVAEERGVDLIIIGSHQPGLQDYFLGSTAAKVVRHAKCSVLVVR
jgi:nucleotide-binding universal stress UspA family protein